MDKVKHYIKNEDFNLLIKMVQNKEREKHERNQNSLKVINNIGKCFEISMIEELDIAKFDKNLTNHILNKNGKQIYKYIKDGMSKYDLNTLLYAVILTEDTESIYNSAIFAKDITKEQFLMCARAMIYSKDAEGIVYFYRHCNKNDGVFNSFDISSDYISMIKETKDVNLITKIIEDINKREELSMHLPRRNIPYGQGLFQGAMWLRDCLKIYLNKIKEAGI